MSVEKILFLDLIDLHSANEETEKLKIDNKYIYKRNNKLYFLNINFDEFSSKIKKIKFSITTRKLTIQDFQYQYNEFSKKSNIDIPTNLFKGQSLEIYFYCCSFATIPEINSNSISNIKLCYRCSFNILSSNENIILKNCIYEQIIGNVKNIEGGTIQKLQLTDTKCKKKFYINKQYNGNSRLTKITNLILVKVIFLENFKLHNCVVDNIFIVDIDFEKNADFFKSTFKQSYPQESKDKSIYMKAINFRKLALFGDCTFQEKIFFKYVTFEGYSHFRRTEFKKGVDLDYTNIQEEMNFFAVEGLNSKASQDNTSQETYRIIKHNFEKIGNKIEANKYHALELEKRKIDKKTPQSEKLVLQLHSFTSRNGTNWWIPLLLIFLVGIITMIGLNFGNPFSYYPQTQTTSIEESFFETFKHIYILYKYKELWDLHPFLLAFNKFSLGYLYYQFLIAVRKDTRK